MSEIGIIYNFFFKLKFLFLIELYKANQKNRINIFI